MIYIAHEMQALPATNLFKRGQHFFNAGILLTGLSAGLAPLDLGGVDYLPILEGDDPHPPIFKKREHLVRLRIRAGLKIREVLK